MDQLENMHKVTKEFLDERNWDNSPANIAKSIVIEAAELLELFQWNDNYDKERLGEELADVIIYCLQLSKATGIDIHDAVIDKFKKNAIKYPVEK